MINPNGRAVVWRGVTLGEGMPKIAIPVMGDSLSGLRDAAQRAAKARADIVELRLDSLSPMPDIALTRSACEVVHEEVGEKVPLLLTLRTLRDGGAGSKDADSYGALLCEAAALQLSDAIDCELSAGETVFTQVAAAAHEAGVSLVGSSHAFNPLADVRVAGEWLRRQRAWGADVCKAAVMPRDTAQALEAAREMLLAARALDAPVIAVCMGAAGAFTRVCAEALGSCLTFAAAGAASAPGQLDAASLRPMILTLHTCGKSGE